MARNIIRLAGGTYARLKALTGIEKLKGREVVITTDTNELFVGKDDGSFELLGGVHFGETLNDISLVDPKSGRFFYDQENSILYLANGIGWKKVAVQIKTKDGLAYDEKTGELTLQVDNKSILINEDGNLETGNIDFGEF